MMLKDSNSNIHNNGNKDSDNSSNKEIILELSKELVDANIVSDIRYILEQKILKITFSNSYNNETLSIQGDVKKWFTWTSRIESSIKKRMLKLNNTHRLLIETTISNNIDLLLDSVDNQSKKLKKSNQGQGEEQEQVKKIHLRKYALDGQLYESVVVDKNSKFLTICTTENSANNENECSSNEKQDNNNNIQ